MFSVNIYAKKVSLYLCMKYYARIEFFDFLHHITISGVDMIFQRWEDYSDMTTFSSPSPQEPVYP